MKTLNNIKVFDFNNPNFTIPNSKEEILEMFQNEAIPIVTQIAENEKVLPKEELSCVGIIVSHTAKLIDDEIYADVYVNNNIKGEFVNYEVFTTSPDSRIEYIDCVEIK